MFGLAAGVTPSVPGRAGDEVEDGPLPPDPSSTDPASRWMDVWRDFVRDVVALDVDAVKPMLTDDELAEVADDWTTVEERIQKLIGVHGIYP